MRAIPTRQVHLDFHTSEQIMGIGAKFDKKQYQEALKAGHLNSITIFGKGHHSMCYYPTKVGMQHPGLSFDFLGAQIEACHEIGVACPVYITVGWSSNEAEAHPEWCVRDKEGNIRNVNYNVEAQPDDPKPQCSWKFLCPSGEYLKLILSHTEEICSNYDTDGLFYDINNNTACYCDNCRKGMAAEGIDIEDDGAVWAYSTRKWRHFFEECRRILFSKHPEATIFFNGTVNIGSSAATGTANMGGALHDLNTHQELEDLPTTWGGYDKLPIRARYFAKSGKRQIGMSGKFHTSWGEFGGFKHPDAIRYEAAAMVAQGVGCSFGDQMHPCGEMDMATYRSIGEGYAYVEKIEEYGIGANVATKLGIWLTGDNACNEGVSVMLLESQQEFDCVSTDDDFSRYEVIVIPGSPSLTEELAKRFNEYVENGGKLLILGAGGMNSERTEMLLNCGVSYVGPAGFDVDYLEVGQELADEMVKSPFLTYEPAFRTKVENAEVLASIREPFFSRTYGHYCSHQNTPYQLEQADHPGVVRYGNVIFMAHALGKMYLYNGARVHRQLFLNALKLLYTKPLSKTELPSSGRHTFLHQPEKQRYVAHLTYATPIKRGRCSVIEDLIPLYDIPLTISVPEEIKSAMLIPDGIELDLTRNGDSIELTIPKLHCHAAVALQY